MRRFGVALALLGLLVGPPASERANAAAETVDALGWKFDVVHTSTDGLAIHRARHDGTMIFRRLSVPHIRVLYAVHPTMNDQLGIGGSANVPFREGSLRVGIGPNAIDVRARYDEGDWPQLGTYRYDLRYLFYRNGSFRVRVYAYGPGLEPKHTYEADIRLDLDVAGAGRDFFLRHYKGVWNSPKTECACRDQGTRDGGAEWVVFDGVTGKVIEILPNDGDGRPHLWGLRWRDGEGNTDLGTATPYPGGYDDDQGLRFANVVVWYRSHARYDRDADCPTDCRTPLVIGPTFRRRSW